MSKLSKKEARLRRHRRLRRKISGTADVPRMCVCRTANHLYVQIIDDEARHTLCSASTVEPSFRERKLRLNTEAAVAVGKAVAERALAANIKRVVFDRGGFNYHGRIKALADAAREAGLQF